MGFAMEINSKLFQLAESLDLDKMDTADCKKAGFLTRISVDAQPYEIVYYAKNCSIHCFDQGFFLYPSQRKYHGADMNWQTAAYLVFAENKLDRVVFQIEKNKDAAERYAEEFLHACQARYGDPQTMGQNNKTWIEDGLIVACQLNDTKTTTQFHLMLN